jgi:endoglycosylceramidase
MTSGLAVVLIATFLCLLGDRPSSARADGPVTSALVRTGRWITDARGRVVVLHGVNIVKKWAPYYPSRFGAQDAAFLANEGFTAARIGFIWAGTEPQPGVYHDAYVHEIADFNDLLGRYGIRTLIDFHQDGWGPSAGYGDGAPAWASLGITTDQDFEDFWDNAKAANGVGIQAAFVDMWRHVVPILDASPGARNILGFDPFNEPYPGSGYPYPCADFSPCPAFEEGALATFYRQVIAAIRSTGDKHLIFPEGVAQNAQQQPSLPAFSDPQSAFNWHFYCGASQVLPDQSGLVTPAYCSSPDASAFKNMDAYTGRLGLPWILSEFGANDADAEYADEVDLMDARFLSWMYWMYYGYPPDAPVESLLINSYEPGSASNAKQPKLDALVVPYPQAIAGTPESYAFDRSTDTMTMTYSTRAVPGARLARGALTQIFVPRRHYPTGYRVHVSGARVVSGPTAPWVELVASQGAQAVAVKIVPRTGSRTELPSQTGLVPIPTPVRPSKHGRHHRHRKNGSSR